MYDAKSGYEEKPAFEKKCATPKQIAFYKALTEELGEAAAESELQAFARMSIGDASDKLTALVQQRRDESSSEAVDSEEPE